MATSSFWVLLSDGLLDGDGLVPMRDDGFPAQVVEIEGEDLEEVVGEVCGAAAEHQDLLLEHDQFVPVSGVAENKCCVTSNICYILY